MDAPKPRPHFIAAEFMARPEHQAWAEERAQLVRDAAPIYKAMLCSLPFYKERENDEQFWRAFIGSQVTSARTLVARAKAAKP